VNKILRGSDSDKCPRKKAPLRLMAVRFAVQNQAEACYLIVEIAGDP
jgi:hypothetical protein